TRPEPASELCQDAQVTLPQPADVGKVVLQLGYPLDAAAECEARPLLRVEADVLEHTRIDHAGAAHLEPARVAARAAAGPVADPARDVRLHRRFGEREIVRSETDTPVGTEDRPHRVQEGALEVGERQPAVDGEALEL